MSLKLSAQRALVSLLPLMPRSLVWRVSKRYIAGTSLEQALDVVASLNRDGMAATLDVLGEDITRADEAESCRDEYLAALRRIHERKLDCNISIKLSAMALRFDLPLCRSIVDSLVDTASELENFVRIDMEDSSVTDETLGIYRDVRKRASNVGTVVQAYLRRTEEDVRVMLAEGKTHLRLCKGIYVEPEGLAFQGFEEVRESFRNLLRQMLEGGIERVGIATHDPPLVEAALDVIRELDVPRERYQFQMLLGVAERLRGELVKAGHPLLVYVPYGEMWYPYCIRRLRENPKIAGHVVKQLLTFWR